MVFCTLQTQDHSSYTHKTFFKLANRNFTFCSQKESAGSAAFHTLDVQAAIATAAGYATCPQWCNKYCCFCAADAALLVQAPQRETLAPPSHPASYV